ncbi:LysE family translocator [Achromobacter sp. F4_2707]|uniref:LysE family translocator n=1 Tax=Achromobacter sp. F4_2707 TaxID=3114286 RepID=UPI0039C5C758
MLPPEVALSFFGIAILLALSPGPDNLFVLMQSAMWGRRAGLWVVLGLCTGLIGHSVAVAVGLAAVFSASAMAFTAVKLMGAAYLVYLAWGALRAGATVDSGERPARQTAMQLYRRGIIMNLTNPKVSIFFLAFLPQFASPTRGPIGLQMLLLGGLFIVATLWVFGAIALFSGAIGERLKKSARAQIWLNRCAGVVFLGLAARLLVTQR